MASQPIFDREFLGAQLVLSCQRTQCDAREVVDLGEVRPEHAMSTAHSIAEILSEDWPEGWGWDTAGVNTVLHCPEHRV